MTNATAVAAVANVFAAGLVLAGDPTLPVESPFDADLDGWVRVLEDGTPASDSSTLDWLASGGNPGGYAYFEDGDGGQPSWIEAPTWFLGDWSSLDGNGEIAFDFTLLARGGDGTEIGDYAIRLEGSGATATIVIPGPESETGWEHVSAPLEEEQWNVVGSWQDLLAEVASLRLKIEIVNNMTTIGEITGIDNVSVSSQVSSAGPTTADHSPWSVQVSPNPVSQDATIRWSSPRQSPTTVRMFGPAGRQVRTLVAPSGSVQLSWDLRDGLGNRVVSGRYFVSDGTQSAPLLVVR